MDYIKKIYVYINTTIIPFIKGIFKNFKFKDYILLILSCLTLIFFSKSCYYENKVNDTVVIYQDSISTYKNKLGIEYAQQQTYISSIKELKDKNQVLYAEIKNLKNTKPIVVTKTKTQFKVDTIYAVADTIFVTSASNQLLKWHAQHLPYYSLKGETKVAKDFSEFSTLITDMKINNELTLDVIEQDNKISVIAHSSNPYIHIQQINSVVIDPTEVPTLKKYFKQKRWGIGPSLGVGVDKNLNFTPYIGISVNYNLFTF